MTRGDGRVKYSERGRRENGLGAGWVPARKKRESCGVGSVSVTLQVQIWELSGLRKASGPYTGCRGLTGAGAGPYLSGGRILYIKIQPH